MLHTSLQVSMDSSVWLQGTLSEDIPSGLDSSSSPSGECNMLAAACSSRAGQPLMERRLRPPHDQNLKCPRCDSTHTKFCYYNNYSLSQPRYFCKTCRRYWTKGGTLRNIPVGGGCRKNKKSSSSKKPTTEPSTNQGGLVIGPSHLSSFPDVVQFPPHHLANLMTTLGGASFMGSPIDIMESKYNNNDNGVEFGVNVMGGYNGMSSVAPFGVSSNDHIINDVHSGISFMDQRLLLPYDGNDHHYHHHHHRHHHDHDHQSGIMINDVKPNPRLLSLDQWQDQGSWTGLMGGFQPSTTNSFM